MNPVTPTKQRGSMGPPATPYTPSTSSTSRSMVITPRTDRSYSSAGRGRSETPFQVKAEPMDPPSPSPKRSREPSTLPPMSPTSGAMTLYQPAIRTLGRSPSRSRTLNLLREMSAAPSRDRFPSESVPPPPSRSSRAPSTVRSQSRFSSLAPSDAGSRIAYRAATSDFDRRTRQRRAPDGDREASNTPAPPVPALPPLNLLIIDSASAVIDIIGQLYVEDVDAEDGTADQDKAEFKQECLDEILEGLFEERTVAETISKELAEEEVTCTSRTVSFLLGVLKTGVADMLNSSMRDFAVEGSKLKAKPARQAAWYGKYKADIPGYRRMLAGLDKVTACTVVSLLGQHWTTELATLKTALSRHSINTKRSHCWAVVESVRKLADVMIADIWTQK